MYPDAQIQQEQVLPESENKSKIQVLLSRAQKPEVLLVQIFRQEYDEYLRTSNLVKPAELETVENVAVNEGCKMVRGSLIMGNRHLRCHLLRLPIQVRYRIYEFIFCHHNGYVEIGGPYNHQIGDLAILRASHLFYHEASIALYHSLGDRLLFFRNYGSKSADFLRRQPTPLPCCRNRVFQQWLEYPCRNKEIVWRRSFKKIVFLIGASEPLLAVQRRWAFAEFITTLRMSEPLRVHELSVVVYNQWKIPGFDEGDLVRALFSGGIEFLGRLIFRGLAEDETERLTQLIFALRIPNLTIERIRTLAKEREVSINLYALKYKIDDGEKDLTVRLCTFESKADDKQSLLVRSSTPKQRGGHQATHWKKIIISWFRKCMETLFPRVFILQRYMQLSHGLA
ncbi:hypothetical protein IFM61606_09243 [Aspergillus udagawae]|uniref:Uncharacterized protein n=1 Tax=Aspergillus udagawae TaxID=91492 RepID=A0ABQ1ANX6_9EURO|nr:hypothetical protein IFM61606_09243 [Aspergillus udagawae]GFF35761.1 hypothetical protein IFM51744_02899 [Aspergillus udagawae]GFF85363.1 hypothetical protein IFM53868_04457 [Aspergillus udagawae]GFG02592.1 hypothetical protein IFM5058_01007 [Aspergillus udagawae]